METGVIVYVVGGENTYDCFGMDEAVKSLKIKADMLEVISSESVRTQTNRQ